MTKGAGRMGNQNSTARALGMGAGAGLLVFTLCSTFLQGPSLSLSSNDDDESSGLIMSTTAKSIFSSAASIEEEGKDRIISHRSISWECLSTAHVRDALNTTENVIVVMPAKAAGTSLKKFARDCNPNTTENLQHVLEDKDRYYKLLTKSWDMPGVYVSHYWKPEMLSRLLRSTSRHTLVVYIHREETSRFASAAHHVLSQWCLHGPPMPQWGKFFDSVTGNNDAKKCIVHESQLVKGLKKRPQEMTMGTIELLTCETYTAIAEYAPNMIFMNYKQASTLQNLLGEKYCPRLVDHTNRIGKGSEKVFVQLSDGSDRSVTLTEWLEKKSAYMEWALGLNDHASCLVNTRRMEDSLGSCDGEFLNARAVLN